MKNKLLYILIGVSALLLAGCKSRDREAFFIPTPAPALTDEDGNSTEDITDNTDEQAGESESVEETTVTGGTRTMYVKLNSYGAILNVRSSPKTDEDNVVGFLVHTEPVEVISIENGWASFMYKGQICYVNADYLVDYVPPYISPPSPSE